MYGVALFCAAQRYLDGPGWTIERMGENGISCTWCLIGPVSASRPYARFFLTSMPGCCGMVVSHDTMVSPRGLGYGTWLQGLKEKIAYGAGFSLLLASDQLDHFDAKRQQKIFVKHNWQEVKTFRNRRTMNQVGLYVKDVRH